MTATFRRQLTKVDLERMNLPMEFWKVKVPEVAESVRPMVERYLTSLPSMMERGAGLLLGGAPGVGKTAVGALVAKEGRALGFTAFFVTVWELREFVRGKVMYDEALSVFDRCKEVDVLVLDGLRPEDAKEMFLGMRAVEELLTSRGARRKISVVTTRMGAGDLRSHMPTLLDSVQGCMVFVQVEGPNKRSAQNQELRKVVFGTG